MAIPFEFPFLHHGSEIIMHSNCILDSVADLLVCHMVFVGNVQKSPTASLIYLSIIMKFQSRDKTSSWVSSLNSVSSQCARGKSSHACPSQSILMVKTFLKMLPSRF